MSSWRLRFKPDCAVLDFGKRGRMELRPDRVEIVERETSRSFASADVVEVSCELVRLPLMVRLGALAMQLGLQVTEPAMGWTNSATVLHEVPARPWQEGTRVFDGRAGRWVDVEYVSVHGRTSLASAGYRAADSTSFWVSKWLEKPEVVVSELRHARFMAALGRKPSERQLEAAWQSVL